MNRSLRPAEKKVLEAIREFNYDKGVSIEIISSLCGISVYSCRVYLPFLVKVGLIERCGSTQFYEPGKTGKRISSPYRIGRPQTLFRIRRIKK